jgi:hypothetical protein
MNNLNLRDLGAVAKSLIADLGRDCLNPLPPSSQTCKKNKESRDYGAKYRPKYDCERSTMEVYVMEHIDIGKNTVC